LLVVACCCALVTGCASSRNVGLASYYADKYQGRKTANGETFDTAKLTAAHKTLPFGTRVRVTNLDNGKSVEVRINDRGPYVAGRVIDLSPAAARKLDMLRAGVVRVRLDVLGTRPVASIND
jgi:rare lipoprotein A